MVVFTLAGEEFGVGIDEVKEIIRVEKITRVPNTPPYILGVINLRGGIVVIIDLAMKLSLATKEIDKNTRIIVIEKEENVYGMVVANTSEVLRLGSEQIEPAPQIITEKIDACYIEGVAVLGERLLILLDLQKVLGSGDVAAAVRAAGDGGQIIQQEVHQKPGDADRPGGDGPEQKTTENTPYQNSSAGQRAAGAAAEGKAGANNAEITQKLNTKEAKDRQSLKEMLSKS